MRNGTFGTLIYDDQPATNEEIRQDIINGTAGVQWPFELFGVGELVVEILEIEEA